jgi:hypothetical protein
MESGFSKSMFWRLGAALLLLSPALAQAEGSKRLLKLATGEETAVWGVVVKAKKPSVLLLSLSSEFTSIAVLDGAITQGAKVARSGDALVTAIDGNKTQQLQFDARRLAGTMSPEWLADAGTPLEAVAARQKRHRYWGLIEPVNLNASAPISPVMEPVRSSYLNQDAIVSLRREARGNPQVLAALTAKRFASALAARDVATVSALIDPKPFTDTGASADAWRAARDAFAVKLTRDAALIRAMAAEPAAVADDQTAFDSGIYRIHLVPRDRALFVTSVETK